MWSSPCNAHRVQAFHRTSLVAITVTPCVVTAVAGLFDNKTFTGETGNVEVLVLEVWPRWLPSPGLRALDTHFVLWPGGAGECGAEVMWADVGHPTTARPRCSVCLQIAEPHSRAVNPVRSDLTGRRGSPTGHLRNQECVKRER